MTYKKDGTREIDDVSSGHGCLCVCRVGSDPFTIRSVI
jgi:hypothetical protein